MSDYRVGIIDSNEFVRSGRALVINSQPDMRVSFELSDSSAAIESVPDYLVDLILVGEAHHQIRGLKFIDALIRELKDAGNQAVVISYGAYTTDKQIYDAVCSGARGYFGLDQTADKMLKLMRTVARTDYVLDPSELFRLGSVFGFLKCSHTLEDKLSDLSETQTSVIEFFLQGLRDSAVAKQLEIPRTRVTQAINSLLTAGDFSSRNQLAMCLLGNHK